MKTQTFHSELPPEMVWARLQSRAKVLKRGWDVYDEHQLFTRLLPDGSFYLWKTGGMLQVRPQLPFQGRVTAEGHGSVITGGFGPTRELKISYGVFIFIVLVALFSVTGIGLHLLVVLPLLAILAAGGWALFTRLPPLFTKRQDGEVLTFIRQNLLEE